MKIREGLIEPQNEREKEIEAEESLCFEIQELIAKAVESADRSQDDYQHLLHPDAELTFRQVARELHHLGFRLILSLK